MLKVGAIVTAVGVVGAALAALVGPAILALLFGPAYRLAGSTLAGLTVGATVLALLTLTGSAILAMALHTQYSFGWLLAVVVAAAVLFLPRSLSDRAVISLILGPAVGLAYHAWVLARTA